MHNFVIQLDTVVSLYAQCPYNKMQVVLGSSITSAPHGKLGLSLPAYVIRDTLVLSALQCLWACPCTVIALTTLVIALYHLFRTEQVCQSFIFF